jgi:hypothetical protein
MAITSTVLALIFLVALHILSPEFSPSWRMISEYAFGHYGWVLSLMFLCFGIGPWALALAIRPHILTRAGRVGLWFLLLSGLGGVMASYFDIRHEIGHAIAGLLGVLGFPIAALLLTRALRRRETWASVRGPLLWVANLTWISVLLLMVTLAIMTMQMKRLNGGHLPQHAPKSLPAGVLPLDGWADRMIVLSNCAWVLIAASPVIRSHRQRQTGSRTKPSELRSSVEESTFVPKQP